MSSDESGAPLFSISFDLPTGFFYQNVFRSNRLDLIYFNLLLFFLFSVF
jgi:hypothetical protein